MIPSIQELEKLERTGLDDVAAVKHEIFSDSITPIMLLRKLRKRSEHVFLFESAEHIGRIDRWTFLGFDPDLAITATDGRIGVRNSSSPDRTEEYTGEPKVLYMLSLH